jgi:CPA1 family monovalent cation:H+ antiporter
MLNLFEMTALILSVTTLACWINAKILKLPVAAGLLVVGLAFSAAIALADLVKPDLGLGVMFKALEQQVDYPGLVLNFMLAYLLFAGAMNVNVGALIKRGWAVAVLAVFGTLITTALIAAAFWGVCSLAGIDMPVSWALVFGALITPTDPIAVLAMTKRTDLEPELQAQLEGEALFNDGVAVVLFKALLAYAIGQSAGGAVRHMDLSVLAQHAAIEAFGGIAVGLIVVLVAVAILAAVNDWITETLITIATATLVYAIALHFGLSGPLGVVAAGLVMGSDWGARAMALHATKYIHSFWHVIDEGMNAVLFFLVGLKAYELHFSLTALMLMVVGAAIVLASRWIAVATLGSGLILIGQRVPLKLYNVLTWAGVRGGLSVALVLSLPDIPVRQPIFAASLGVVLFSIVIQSMTMERLALRTGYGSSKAEPEPTH